MNQPRQLWMIWVPALWMGFLLLQFIYIWNAHPYSYDEGTYWLTLKLMSSDEKLYSSIFCSQFPLFIHFSHWFYRLFGESLGGARLGWMLISSLSIPGFYLLGSRLHGPRFGVVLAALGAFDNLFFHLAHHLVGDAAAVTLLIWAACFATLNTRLWYFLSGMVFGAGLQIKPTLLPLVPLFPFWIVVCRGNFKNVVVWGVGFVFLVGGSLWFFDWVGSGGFQQFQGGTFASSAGSNISLALKAWYFIRHSGYSEIGNPLVIPLFFFFTGSFT